MANRTRDAAALAKLDAVRSPQRKPHDAPAPLDASMLKRLYAAMLKCRMVEESARRLFREGKVAAKYCAVVGREATEVGSTIDLLPEDAVAPSHRNFVTHVIQGAPLKFLYAQLYARQTSPGQGRLSPHCDSAPLHVVTPALSIAAQLNIATGVALAYQMQKKPNVVVALSGDGSAWFDLCHEAINFSGVHSLPILYVIEHTESAHAGKQNAFDDLSVQVQSCGVPAIKVDGNDVVAVHRVAQEAIKRARDGHGPTLIECKIYRRYGHSEIDLARHPSPEEVEYWKARDPIPAMERYLVAKDLWSEEWKLQLTAEFNREIEEAIQFAANLPCPEPKEASRRKPRRLTPRR